MNKKKLNIDIKTIEGFGFEWSRFDQSEMSEEDAQQLFKSYFSIFPWSNLPFNSVGFDLGCGSGRWARYVAPKVGKLHCIDPSIAINVAMKNLDSFRNCHFHRANADEIPLKNYSMDFGYSLGVLHHIPDTLSALRNCVRKLKPGAPFLLYLYYAFDNKPFWFKVVWKLSDLLRICVSRLPHNLRFFISQIIAISIYWPLARFAWLLDIAGFKVENFPLAVYRNCGFYVMRTDALDRFGTRLEQRFTRDEILKMMELAGLQNIKFSQKTPYWCAVGFAKL
jgi:SAM-dependent methyltransferase